MTILRNVTAELGPREVVLNGRVVATVDDITVDVEEATEEELAELKSAVVILLLKPVPAAPGQEANHEK